MNKLHFFFKYITLIFHGDSIDIKKTSYNFLNSVLYVQFWLNFEQKITRDRDQGFTRGNIPSYDSP